MRKPFVLLMLPLVAGTASAACANGYIYGPGTYTYQTDMQGKKSEMTSKAVATANGMTVTSVVGGKPVSTAFKCENGTLKVQGNGMQMGMTNLPDEQLWKPGYSWNSQMKMDTGDVAVNANTT